MPYPSSMSRVDAHHHLWDLDVRDQPWIDATHMAAIRRSFDPDDLGTAVDGCGVAATVLVQVLNRLDETEDLLEIATASSLVAGVVGWANLESPDLVDQIGRLRLRGPLVGIRHQLQAEAAPAEWLRRPDIAVGLGELATAGLPFDLMIRPEQFDAALDAVRARPGLMFVLDHLGKPPIGSGALEPWAQGLRRLAGEANVTAKLSGLVTVADHDSWQIADLRPYIDVALETFGPSRLMFGSDWPVCLLAASYPEVVAAVETLVAQLTCDEQREIWSVTAGRVYSLG
jgi:L-fuconolactonase